MNKNTNRFQILTNGKMRSYVTPSGRGGLFYDWIAMTRFSETSPEACGPMIYLRERSKWALATRGDSLEDLDIKCEVGIAPDTDVEIRKITLTNHDDTMREIELTTYAEIALNHPLGDAGHPAFSKLFVQTSVTAGVPTLLARRRPRGQNENWPWMAQTLITLGLERSWETNRATFIGRSRTALDPQAMDQQGALSCQTGNVLDPVMAWRCKVALGPEESQVIWLVTAVAADEKSVLKIIENCQKSNAAESFLDKARAAEIANLAKLEIDQDTAARYETLAAKMLFGRKYRQVPLSENGSKILQRWPLSWEEIRVVAAAGLMSAGTLDVITALPFWNSLGLKVRLFVMDTIGATAVVPENVAIVDPASFTADELEWWYASAQLVVGAEVPPAIISDKKQLPYATPTPPDYAAQMDEKFQCFNGYGGFSANGREYVIPMSLKNGRLHLPPMPWVNVLANPNFGCIVSDRGAGYTWSRNSQANRLTAWSNDPISDPHSEAFYLLDEDTGELWSPLPGPCPPQSAFIVRHGFGRTRFISNIGSLSQQVEILVPPEDSIKLVCVRLKNNGSAPRNLVFSSYQRLLLCSAPDRHHATLSWTDENHIQHAINPRAGDFADGRVFSFMSVHGVAVEREKYNNSASAFLGEGGIADPTALADGGGWESARGFGHDACFSNMTSFILPPDAEVEILIGFGEVGSLAEENRLIEKYEKPGAMRAASAEVDAYWEKMLGHVRIKTPLPEVDLMVNGWLLYQNLACRIWGRSAFYQSGGAYGFRDQLQDSGALAISHPALMRSQILLHAAQQFPEGDVTHWWHPEPMGNGMRTKFADDLLWLPYLTDHYVNVTGDQLIFEELCPFIHGPLLAAGEDEAYIKLEISTQKVSVFEHCCLAIDKSLTRGAHGLPLMGIGDWNDGMSRIGREGKGESVWMGFFMFAILNQWIPRCEKRNDFDRAKKYRAYRDELLTAIQAAGWDGEWYRRAYYDDGTPLGTHTDDECRIDALAQAWAVISKAAPGDRIEKSLDSLERELVDEDHHLIRLLHPPFVNTPHDPGYIKGYVAGVRENGGQYTHAACWVIRAMAEAGRKNKAAELLQHLSPIWHSRDAKSIARYQVEPYVVAADIYSVAPHIGRGGWTWYTGSAGWMFRVTMESILGLTVENGDTLVLDPRIPDDWPGFSIDFRTNSQKTLYRIEVLNPSRNSSKVSHLSVDEITLTVEKGIARWPMLDDGKDHSVKVTLGGH